MRPRRVADRRALAILALLLIAGCVPYQPPEPVSTLLLQVSGQVCSGAIELHEMRYTIGVYNGDWAVHDVSGEVGHALHDAGWLPASAGGSSVGFRGISFLNVEMTAIDPHTVDASFNYGASQTTLHCVPAPPGEVHQ
jgi:hypothetical protein